MKWYPGRQSRVWNIYANTNICWNVNPAIFIQHLIPACHTDHDDAKDTQCEKQVKGIKYYIIKYYMISVLLRYQWDT